MYKLDLPIDHKEAAAIERRRKLEEDRKSRIFNPKFRTIGVDPEALEQQHRDRSQREELEKRREHAFAADAVRSDKLSMLLQQRQERDIRELNMAMNDFRTLHQQPQGRREWDLYDPDGKKKDKPARISDDDPRCGIASLQKFDGEDLNMENRLRYQQDQTRDWALRQMDDKKRAQEDMEKANRLYELKMRELDQRASELARAEDECRRAISMATSDYNRSLSNEKAIKEAVKRQQEEDDKLTDIQNQLNSDLLTENPAVATSAFGPHRVVPDRWKGMSPEQLEEIRKQQKIQAEEAERRRMEEMQREHQWDEIRKAQARQAMLLERQSGRQRKEVDRDLSDINRRLAYEQQSYNQHLEKEVYTNPPTAAYFMQFNTTTR